VCKRISEETWAKARQMYVDSDTQTQTEVAKACGIGADALSRRAAARNENWASLRENRRDAEIEAEKKAVQTRAELNADAQVDARALYRKVARRILDRTLQELRPERTVNADHLSKLSAVVQRCQEIEWACYGIAKVLDVDVSMDVRASVVEIPVESVPERGDLPESGGGVSDGENSDS